MNFLKTRPRSKRNSPGSIINNGEKWRKYSRRMSFRDNDYFGVDGDNFEPLYQEVKDWIQEFFERKSDTADRIDQDVEVNLTKKQTLILSTLVPDELLLVDDFNNLEPKRFVGVLMMADVSGYTALSERYNNTGKGGTYRLTVTLNTYLGSLVDLIYSHGGDILKFAGDAFLALWKTDKRSFLSHTIHTVIACALVIQHSYGSYETDVKVHLKVKLAISAGNLIFAPIGSGLDMNYVIFGLPVIEAKAAESLCTSGEVKLTPTAWGHCYSRNYDHVLHENGYVTIKAILYDPHEKIVTKPFAGLGALIRQAKRTYTAIENLPDHYWDNSKAAGSGSIVKENEVLGLRETITLSLDKNIGSELRKYMIRPVLTQIDAHQPLEYLTEMRQVSVLFLTLKPKECSYLQLITIVNNSYQITCEIVYKSIGCVNKIILFDKDVMILVIFGLRGFKRESEAQAALKCAYSIKKYLSALNGVAEVSIGVTTGQVYCGVVGHPLRREFTVIGATVNKAARLMCGFRNKITCDEPTFIKSKISSNSFTLQPCIELKGIGRPGKIYEYTEEIRVKELYDIPIIVPLLNRSDEIEYFANWLQESHRSYRDFDALLIIGESRLGKSKLLEWMARHAKSSGYCTCSVNLTSIHSSTPYLGLSQITDQLLELQEPIEGFAKEEKIVQLLKVYSDNFCYLNNIIQTRFAYHEALHLQDESTRKEQAILIYTELVKAINKKYVLLLDDIQNLDQFSWEFISLMFKSFNIFTVMTITRGKFSDVHQWLYNIFINNNIRKMCLPPLEHVWIPALACQILDVNAVPYDLCKALQDKCHGMPGLVEGFITHLFSTGAIEIKRVLDNDLSKWDEENLQFPDQSLLHPQTLDPNYQNILDEHIKNNSDDGIDICLVTNKDELNTNIDAHNIDALIMIQIDSLTPYQQLLLKIASVIGNIVPRDLLEDIMYENDPIVTARAVKRLFAINILSCANAPSYRWEHKKTKTETKNLNLICNCNFEYDSDNSNNLPKYAFCKLMRFKNKSSRQTFYELLPINQKKEFHSRILNNLEYKRLKCYDCGGTIMMVASMLSIMGLLEKEDSSSNLSNSILLVTEDENSNNDDNSQESDQQVSFSNEQNDNEKKSIQSTSISFTKQISKPSKASSDIIYTANSRAGSKVSENYVPILKTSTSEQTSTVQRRSTKKVTLSSIAPLSPSNSTESVKNYNSKFIDMIRAVAEAEELSDWHKLGIIDSTDKFEAFKKDPPKHFSVKIEKNVSQTNFSKCTCADLNVTVCEQLIHHAQEAGLKQKAIEFLIKYSYLCVANNNVEKVFVKLDEAEDMCKSLSNTIDAFSNKRYLGKIFSIRAAACLLKGQLSAAKIELEKAVKIYNINLHKVSQYLNIHNLAKLFRDRRKHKRDQILKADSIFCLNTATLLYNLLGDERITRLTAYRAVNIVRSIECPVVAICDAYSNALQLELERGSPEATSEIENMAARTLKELSNPIQGDELFGLGKLFLVIFKARMARGNLVAAVRSGFRALAVSRFMEAEDVILDIIPDLFYILLARRRIEEAVDIMQFVLRSNRNLLHESEVWYYALCLDMILDGGFQLESPNDITRFAEYALSTGKIAGPGYRRLIVGLWLYWLRADCEKKAKLFESEVFRWFAYEEDGSLTSLISALRLSEGLLESLSRKMDDLRKVVDLMELRSIADRELARLENDARLMRTIYPRWCLLQAFSARLSNRLTLANNFIYTCAEESRRIYNRLEEALATAANVESTMWIQSARACKFMYWREAVEYTRTAAWNLLLYSIPTSNSRH